jgi:hypothetical protein
MRKLVTRNLARFEAAVVLGLAVYLAVRLSRKLARSCSTPLTALCRELFNPQFHAHLANASRSGASYFIGKI